MSKIITNTDFLKLQSLYFVVVFPKDSYYLLPKVIKEVNICVGRILYKADVDALNQKTSLYNYRNKKLQRATDTVQLPVVVE